MPGAGESCYPFWAFARSSDADVQLLHRDRRRLFAQLLRRPRRPGQADDARDEECRLGAADGAEPAGEQTAERAGAVEGIEVDADDAAAQVVGCREHLRGRIIGIYFYAFN